jgi:serine/threonine protein kinase
MPALWSVLGDYELMEKVGEGAAGSVFKARDKRNGDVVAVKVLSSETARNPTLLKRFEQEFRAASTLQHPNIVRALRYCGAGERPFLVMEYVAGEAVGAKIDRCGRIPEAEAVSIIRQVSEGLAYAHQRGLIHRDVKPDNIVVTPTGLARLLDLGLVKGGNADLNLTRTGRGLGTPHFMAPEQFRNAKGAGVRCDIYSLGATLYQMVTGELPFRGKGPVDTWTRKVKGQLAPARRLVPELSERTAAAIHWAMSPEAAERPASCQEWLDVLTGTGPLSSKVLSAPQGDSQEPQAPGSLRRHLQLAVGLALAGAVAVLLGQMLFR